MAWDSKACFDEKHIHAEKQTDVFSAEKWRQAQQAKNACFASNTTNLCVFVILLFQDCPRR